MNGGHRDRPGYFEREEGYKTVAVGNGARRKGNAVVKKKRGLTAKRRGM